MKSIFKHFFSQCARPEGFLGRVMLRFMNFGHAPLTNWGLGHVAFSEGMSMLDIGCGGGVPADPHPQVDAGAGHADRRGNHLRKEIIKSIKKTNMEKKTKVIVLWLLTICGFASHSVTDLLPLFWGKNIAIATDGNVPGGMIAFMMLLSFFLPACAILCLLPDAKGKALKWANAVMAVFVALFNIAHLCMELPSENAGQYLVLPMMAVIGICLAWHSCKLAGASESHHG